MTTLMFEDMALDTHSAAARAAEAGSEGTSPMDDASHDDSRIDRMADSRGSSSPPSRPRPMSSSSSWEDAPSQSSSSSSSTDAEMEEVR